LVTKKKGSGLRQKGKLPTSTETRPHELRVDEGIEKRTREVPIGKDYRVKLGTR